MGEIKKMKGAKKGNELDAAQLTLTNYQESQKYTITNILAHTNLGLNLNLYYASNEIKELEFEPDQFQHAILKVRKPKLTFLIFRNGTVICQGGKDPELIKKLFERIRVLLLPYSESSEGVLSEDSYWISPLPQLSPVHESFCSPLPYPSESGHFSPISSFRSFPTPIISCPTLTIQKELPLTIDNIVVKSNFKKKVDLVRLSTLSENVEYDPERFISAATLKFENSTASAKIYTNGKVICMGAKNLNEISSLIQKVYVLIKKQSM